MFAKYPESSFSVDSFFIWFGDKHGRALRPWLIFRRGSKEQKLLPVLKDIISTQFPFIDPGRLNNDLLYSVEVSDLSVALIYLRKDGCADVDSDVRITIETDDILDALKVDKLNVGLYLYGSSEAGSGGDDELLEAYDFAIGRDDPPSVSISTEEVEEDLIIGGSDYYDRPDRA